MTLDEATVKANEMTSTLEERIKLFEEYLRKNQLEKDFQAFCEERRQKQAELEQQRKLEKYPLKDRVPKI